MSSRTQPHRRTTTTSPALSWQRCLAAMTAAGESTGRNAADWWCQEVLGGRAYGDTAAAARRILTGLDDGDPEVSGDLPASPITAADTELLERVYLTHGAEHAGDWDTVATADRAVLLEVYASGFEAACQQYIGATCRRLLADAPDPARTRLHLASTRPGVS